MKKIGFIGAGNMATAIIKGIIARNGNADNINVFDVSEEKQNLMKELGAERVVLDREITLEPRYAAPALM